MNRNHSIGIVAVLIFVAAFTRLIPHWPNFTAVAAVALIGGSWINNKVLAFLLPLAALFVSDIVLNNLIFTGNTGGYTFFYSGMPWVYGAFVLTTLLGIYGLKGAQLSRPLPFTGYALLASVMFYLLTNLGAWIGNPIYAQTFEGLLTAFVAGIPFALNFTAGTLFFGFAMLGAQQLLSPVLAGKKS